MRVKPFLIDSVTGNSKLLATYSGSGELLRLWWPHIDYPQFVEEIKEGIFLKGKTKHTVFRESADFIHSQDYAPDSPTILTRSVNEKLKLELLSVDFAPYDERDLLVRSFTLKNNSKEKMEGSFVYYSRLSIDENQRYATSLFDYEHDSLLQYRHKYFVATASNRLISGYTTDEVEDDMEDGKLDGINLMPSKDGAFTIDFEIEPGEVYNIDIYMCFGLEKKERAFDVLKNARQKGGDLLKRENQTYWENFLSKGALDIKDEKIREIYKRSLMVFKLASDEETGGLIAAPEFDEYRVKCGGYSYCWGRDAAYIATAIEKAGYPEMVEKFYNWALMSQDEDGSWDQRHFMEGYLAPVWGLQIDEGASLIWGMWKHYSSSKNEDFFKTVYEQVIKGTEYIYSFFDEETKMPKESKDLWEERTSQALYSTAAVYSGLLAGANFAKKAGEKELAEKYTKRAAVIKDAVKYSMWNDDKDTFYRGMKLLVNKDKYAKFEKGEGFVETDPKGYKKYFKNYDDIVDISLIGACYPFDLFEISDPMMKKTAHAIEDLCTSPIVGGIKRYEDDHYIEGNPWILTTLWLAIYYARLKDVNKAKKYFDWATKHATKLGLLPEQVDKRNGKTAWVLPLTWSHAMYVLATLELRKLLEI